MEFYGEFSDLEILVSGLGYTGQWDDDNGKKVFRSKDKAILNWWPWPSTGTLQIQGPEVPRDKFREALRKALCGDPSASDPSASTEQTAAIEGPSPAIDATNSSDGEPKQIFVVYGHDEAARDQLELVLRRLGLEPFVLGITSGDGLTIIEALEKQILSPNESDRFGIVLLTPDDMGYRRGDSPENPEPRARQNVVMEMGMLIAAFGRERVAILKKGHVVIPSDVAGIIYLSFNNHVREIVAKLCQRLVKAGFGLSSDSIVEASS